MASLQEQLIKAGVADKKKAKQIKNEKRMQAKRTPKGQSLANETKEQVQKALAEKSARDREINRKRQQAADLKAIGAQIKQLIEVNRIDRCDGELAYQFIDAKKIKKIYVTPTLQNQLSNGVIAIVGLKEQYELVPSGVADKIAQRDERIVLVHNQSNNDSSSDGDPYADYQIPDDLMW